MTPSSFHGLVWVDSHKGSSPLVGMRWVSKLMWGLHSLCFVTQQFQMPFQFSGVVILKLGQEHIN